MDAKRALLVVLFQGTIYSWGFPANEDFTSHAGYFITRENKGLTGHIVKQFESPSLMSCSQSCLRNTWCSSTNFKVSSKKDGKGTCELNKNDNTLINEKTKLNEQQGVTFSMFLKVRHVILKGLFCKKMVVYHDQFSFENYATKMTLL